MENRKRFIFSTLGILPHQNNEWSICRFPAHLHAGNNGVVFYGIHGQRKSRTRQWHIQKRQKYVVTQWTWWNYFAVCCVTLSYLKDIYRGRRKLFRLHQYKPFEEFVYEKYSHSFISYSRKIIIFHDANDVRIKMAPLNHTIQQCR